MSSFFNELKRRNVVRVGLAYLVMSWLVLQIGDVAADNLDFPQWFMPMVFVVLGLGFPVALFLSWAFEMTPEGVKKTVEVDADASITPNTGRKLDRMIIVTLVVAVAFLVYERATVPTIKVTPSEPTAANTNAAPIIAVLPFVNMSSDPEQEYFSDGISEEILNVLARTNGLQVVSRTSAFQFKGSNRNITEIAASLNANIILEGSVRKGGNRVRITAQLIDAKTGLHLWSDTYDRELTDIFAVQDEISKAIATALLGAVGIEALPENRFKGTNDVTAYNIYLRANALKSTRIEDNLEEAVRLYEQVVGRAPNFADAWAGLAKARHLAAGNFSKPIDFESVNLAASRALAIDPENGQALAVQGLVHLNRLRLAEARQVLERAIVAAPTDPDARFWLGMVLFESLEIDAGLEQLEITRKMDPTNFSLYMTLALNYGAIGKFDQAQDMIDAVQRGEIPISAALIDFIKPHILFSEGREAEALALVQETFPDEIDRGQYLFYYTLAARSGEADRIARAAELLEQRIAEGEFVYYHGAFEWLELGEREKARAAFVRTLGDGMDLTEVRTFIALAAIKAPGFYQMDPRPVLASIPFIREAYERAGIPAFEGVEPYLPDAEKDGGDGE